MLKLKTSAVINRSIEEVFEFVANTENDMMWQSDVLEAKDTSEGPIGVGHTYKQTFQFLGRRLESTYEVTEFEANRKFMFKNTAGPIPIEGGFTCEPVPEGATKITLNGEADVGGFFKLAEPIVNRMLQRQWETNLSNLKDLLEAQD